MKIFGYEINFGKVENATQKLPEKSNIRNQIKFEQTLYRARQDIGTWRSALLQAESVINPNRTNLYRLYKDLILDAHLSACISTRKNQVLQSEFIVCDEKGNEIEDKTKLLQNKWFYDFVNHSLDSLFYGHSLIQFHSLVNDIFKAVELVPREYVKPEYHLVVPNPGMTTGTNYLDSPYDKWVIGVGETLNLGLLAKAAPYILWKKLAMGAWAEYTEIFGTPIRIGKTNDRDSVTRTNMEGFLKNLGTAGWGVFDKDDIVELIESNKSDAYEVFDKLIERCNSEISKLIIGQTGTTDEKSYSGSANVHERILYMYKETDEKYLQSVFKYQLIPLMNKHGMGFENLYIKIKEDDKFTSAEKAKIDIELLKYYTIPKEYIEAEYGTPVEDKIVEKPVTIKNKLDKYYK